MSTYPGTESETRVPFEILLTFCARVFAACGMKPDDARLLGETLTRADLRGVHSHGVLRVPDYVKKLLNEGVDPRAEPSIVSDRIGALVVDGRNSMGQIAATFGMRAALARAQQSGVATAAVRGSNHCGAMAYYAMLALPEDMIGIAMTNALPTMAPWGGVDKILGINPLGVAIPADREPPIVFDAAFSASSHGKIRIYHQKGFPIPTGWAFDAAGHPTTDAGAALEGLLQPIGGYKGTGLAIIAGVLSTLLAGASFGTELGNMVDGPRPGADGQFLMAINVDAFTDLPTFKARIDMIVRQVRTSRLAPGFDRVYAPGELEAETERAYRTEGIPLNQETLRGLAVVAQRVKISPDVGWLPSS